MDNINAIKSNNHGDLRLSNSRKDPVAKFRGGGIGNGGKSRKNNRTPSSHAYPWGDDIDGEELRITFDLPSDAAKKLEEFSKQCLDDQEKVDGSTKPHYQLLNLGIKSLQFEGNQKLLFSKTRPSTTSKEQPRSSKNLSTAPSLLINLLNQDSGSNKFSENYQTDEDRKVRLKLKMPGSNSATALTTPKLPSETSLSVVSSAATTEDVTVSPPKVPKLIVSMRNKTIKTSSVSKDKESSNHRKTSAEHSPNRKNATKESMQTAESQKLDQCLISATMRNIRNVTKKINGSSIKASNDTRDASPSSSPPSSALASSSSSNSTKMVPVKLVTVTKGEGNVRLVRVSPVRGSSSANLSAPDALSSDSHKSEILVNGNNVAEEVPSSPDINSDDPSRKRPSRELNLHECLPKQESGGSPTIDNRHLTKI